MKAVSGRKCSGFTLAEVVISAGLGAMVVGSSIYGYVMSTKRAEWAGYSLAAQSLALQGLEQARACKWDPTGTPLVDELVATNFPTQTTNILDIPFSGTNIVYATNFWTITTISTNPMLKMVKVDCVWRFMNKRNFTNSVVSYRTSDQ